MKKKVKVLQVIPRLGYGGAETGCYDLAHFLAEQNCKSFIATSGGSLLKYVNKKKVKTNKKTENMSSQDYLIGKKALIKYDTLEW